MQVSQPQIIAIITARGGSKGLPGKNVALLAGKPLIVHSILAAQGCSLISRTVVTTDDAVIATVAREAGAQVVMRPEELANDTARSQDAVRHCLEVLAAEGCRPDFFVLLQPTSPLRTARHIQDCLSGFLASKAASGISVVEESHSPFKAFVECDGLLQPLFDRALLSAPRQSLTKVYRQNGAIYVVAAETFLQHDNFFVEPAWPYEMSAEDSVDIDSQLDLSLAEFVISSMVSSK
jgi:CMP-N-acetylneuraminic acid synthetase